MKLFYIGVRPGNALQAQKLSGIRRYAAMRGWDVEAIADCASLARGVKAALRGAGRAAGCVVQCRNGLPIAPEALFRRVPAVYFDADAAKFARPVVSVTSDDLLVARMALRELVSTRPASLAFAGYFSLAPWNVRRKEAFLAEARATGLPASAFPAEPGDTFTNSIPEERLAAWLSSLPKPCAVMAASDSLAVRIVRVAKAARMSVPRDASVIGVDNRADAEDSGGVPISSVVLDHERAGFLAARAIGEGASGPVVFAPLMVARRRSTGGRGRRADWIDEAVRMIREEACDGLSPRRLAARFPISRWLFEMRFREATGHSVLNDILGARMEKAAVLLASSATPVAVVSDMCGFGSYDSFHDLFRRQFGMAPTAFRALHRK